MSPYPTVEKVVIVKYIDVRYFSLTDISRKVSSIQVILSSTGMLSSSRSVEKKTHKQAIIWIVIKEANKKKIKRSKPWPSCKTSYACLSILLFCLTTFTKRMSRVNLISLYIRPNRAILVTPFISLSFVLAAS